MPRLKKGPVPPDWEKPSAAAVALAAVDVQRRRLYSATRIIAVVVTVFVAVVFVVDAAVARFPREWFETRVRRRHVREYVVHPPWPLGTAVAAVATVAVAAVATEAEPPRQTPRQTRRILRLAPSSAAMAASD